MAGNADLRKGAIIELDEQPYRVLDYSQKVMGRGGSIVKVKLKNLLNGAIAERTIGGNDQITQPDIKLQTVQFLYGGGESFNFMDNDSYEQYDVAAGVVGDDADLLKEGMELKVVIYNGNVVGLELPLKLEFEVIEAPDVVKGDTQSTVLKEVKLDNGLEVRVPMFIKQGDVIIVDSRDRSYVERKKS